MLPIEWSPDALEDLGAIATYIARDSAAAAERLRRQIEESVLPASAHPYMFRAGRVAGTREVVAHPNYIVVYRVLADRIRVIAVVHASRRYPPPDCAASLTHTSSSAVRSVTQVYELPQRSDWGRPEANPGNSNAGTRGTSTRRWKNNENRETPQGVALATAFSLASLGAAQALRCSCEWWRSADARSAQGVRQLGRPADQRLYRGPDGPRRRAIPSSGRRPRTTFPMMASSTPSRCATTRCGRTATPSPRRISCSACSACRTRRPPPTTPTSCTS